MDQGGNKIQGRDIGYRQEGRAWLIKQILKCANNFTRATQPRPDCSQGLAQAQAGFHASVRHRWHLHLSEKETKRTQILEALYRTTSQTQPVREHHHLW